MFKSLSWKITLRFLLTFRKNRSSFWFSLICLIGIMLTVFVFFTVQAVITGYQTHIRKTLMGFEAPLQIVTPRKETSQKVFDSAKKIQTNNLNLSLNVNSFQMFYGFLRAMNTTEVIGVKVRSFDSKGLKNYERFKIYWNDGYDLESFLDSENAILLGEKVYKKLPVFLVEDEILELIHPFADLGPTGEFEPQVLPYEVAGVFSSGLHQIDEYFVFVSDKSLQALHPQALQKYFTQIHLKDFSEIPQLQESWQNQNPNLPKLVSFFDKNQILLKLMALEKIVIVFVFALLFLIATVNLTSLVHIFGMAHLKDIMVLKAMGASQNWIRKLFLQMGFVLGGLGTIIGLSLSGALVFYFQEYPFEMPSTYGFAELPIVFPVDVFFELLIGVPLFCILVAWWPARKYIHKPVIETLRKT